MIRRILLMIAVWFVGSAANYVGVRMLIQSFKWLGAAAIGGFFAGVVLAFLGIVAILLSVFIGAGEANKKEKP